MGHPIDIPATLILLLVAIVLGTPVAPILLVGWAAVCEYLPEWSVMPIWIGCATIGIYCNIRIIAKVMRKLKK